MKLPESLRSTRDPCDGNPFSDLNPRHAVWAAASRVAEEEVSRVGAQYLHGASQSVTLDELADLDLWWAAARFDVWAKRGVCVVWSEPELHAYDEWLFTYAENWLTTLESSSRFPTEVLGRIRTQIVGRMLYWKAEARRYRAEQEAQTPPVEPSPQLERHPATWGDVSIEFTSDERVQIAVFDKKNTQNYSEMGFSDGRTGKPTQAWIFLRALAEKNGVISAPPAGMNWSGVEKRVQKIREVLRAHFLNQGFAIPQKSDPLPFSEGAGNGYRATFKVTRNRSFYF